MKLLFVHDHKFRKIGNNFYSTGGLNDEVLSRYTKYFDSVVVLSRVIEEDSIGSKYSLITNPKVKIINSKKCSKKDLKLLIKENNKVIVRLPCFNGLKILPLCKKYNKNYLIELVACPWDSFWNYDWRGKVIAPFIYSFNKYYVKQAPNVLYVTEEFLQRRYPNKKNNIACSDVVLEDSNELVLQKRLEKISKMSSVTKLNLGTLAAVDVKYKGQYRVIKALSLLKKEGIKNFRYHLAGNGDTQYLRTLAKKYDVDDIIFFDGGIPHENIADWFDKIDIYIQPSLQEGLPRALVEAMNYALPCIGSETGGIPELLNKETIFSNHNSILNLVKILKVIGKDDLKHYSAENYHRAQNYSNTVLQEKRNKFYEYFRNQSDFLQQIS